MAVGTGARPLQIIDADDVERAARALAAGAFVIHAFANLYALTTRGDARIVREANLFKGRPAGQVGSATTTPARLHALFDTSLLPGQLRPADLDGLVDELLCLGPFGFLAPAASQVPAHLTVTDEAGRPWVQVIVPGYRCPSNAFLARCLHLCGTDHLHITSANRSRHATGAVEEPAHYRAAALRAEFGADPRLVILEQSDEAAVQDLYPWHPPMSVTVLGFRAAPGSGRCVTLERHGSFGIEALRPILRRHRLELAVPVGQRRLGRRVYQGMPVQPGRTGPAERR